MAKVVLNIEDEDLSLFTSMLDKLDIKYCIVSDRPQSSNEDVSMVLVTGGFSFKKLAERSGLLEDSD
jgi:hypothetical protein